RRSSPASRNWSTVVAIECLSTVLRCRLPAEASCAGWFENVSLPGCAFGSSTTVSAVEAATNTTIAIPTRRRRFLGESGSRNTPDTIQAAKSGDDDARVEPDGGAGGDEQRVDLDLGDLGMVGREARQRRSRPRGALDIQCRPAARTGQQGG